MRIHGEKLEDVVIVEKILRSMLPKFNFVICSIEESKDLDTLSIDELQNCLLVYEQKIIQQDREEQALKAITNSKGAGYEKGRWKEKNGQHRNEKNKVSDSQRKDKGRDKSSVKCYRCHRYGHYRSECRTNLNKYHGRRSNFTETKEAEIKEEEVSLLMVCHSNEETSSNMWYLDTGCSNHMCGSKSAFSELDEFFHDTMKFGDNSSVSVTGKEKVQVSTKSNSIHTINNVLFVLDLKANLLSVGQLQEKGYEIIIKDRTCRIQDKKLGLIAQVNMTINRLFLLYLNNTTQSCFSARLKKRHGYGTFTSDI
ncbi:hypothetical protein GH714_021775 [Hevea brasiliensis]|uniref:CCHC-type domain-containing protein n=1 Tax=Hevea brasiliensis TaxID=3981 RepID=A0A6A6N658_HEVBR|nr:hypothetical protein GH714_021775 [Hevea brasiliensis]